VYLEAFELKDKVRVWRRIPQPAEATGVLGAKPPPSGEFYKYFFEVQ